MKNNSCVMIFSTCNEYSFIWKYFFASFEKYWPEFDMPIVSTASQNFDYGKYHVRGTPEGKDTSFSGRLIETLKSIDCEFVLFNLDDFILNRRIDNHFMSHALSIMINNPKIKHITLHDEISDKEYGKSDFDEYFCIKKNNVRYSVTAQVGFWRKDYLLKILRHKESAWGFEKFGSGRQRIYRGKFLYRKDKYKDSYYYTVGGVLHRGKLINSKEVDAIVDEFHIDREACQIKDNSSIASPKKVSIVRKINRRLYRYFSAFFPHSHFSGNF